MDNLTLEIANNIAKSKFGKSEIIGFHHNHALYNITRNSSYIQKEIDVEKVKKLSLKYFNSLPSDTFGKLLKIEYSKLIDIVINSIDIEKLTIWKTNDKLSTNANKHIAKLFSMLNNFTSGKYNIENGKKELEEWQNGIKNLKTTTNEKVILNSCGSIARYSLAFWILNDELPNSSGVAMRKCKKEKEIKRAAMDIVGGIFGGIVGGTLGGPIGAGVGSAAGSALVSGIYEPI